MLTHTALPHCCCVGVGMHLLRHSRPSATHRVIVFAVVLLLQANSGVVAFVARVAAGSPVASATKAAGATSTAAASLSKINPSGTQLASTKSTGITTGAIARKGLTMAAQSSSTAEVIVVGSCNTDLVTYTPRLPGRGEATTYVHSSMATSSMISYRTSVRVRTRAGIYVQYVAPSILFPSLTLIA